MSNGGVSGYVVEINGGVRAAWGVIKATVELSRLLASLRSSVEWGGLGL